MVLEDRYQFYAVANCVAVERPFAVSVTILTVKNMQNVGQA